MEFKTIENFDVKNKTVLLRADLNVPVDGDKNVTDFTRIDRVKPTIDALSAKGARIVILSHFGRPKGKVNPEYSLEFLAPVLATRWNTPVGFGADSPFNIVLLENLRFNAGEEKNDMDFAKELAAHGDIYINDAFSVSHRAHASVEGITHLLPSGAGLLMEAELTALNNALEAPEKPVMAIVGGSKISTKLSVLNNMVKKVDYLVLGGAMANTFLYAKGHEVGTSMCEKDMLPDAQEIMATAKENNCEIVLPLDCVVVDKLDEDADSQTVPLTDFPQDKSAVDVGAKSIQNVIDIAQNCKTVLWNGPMGVFEIKPFDMATNKVAQAVAKLTQSKKLVSVAGGGDTVAALENAGVIHDFTYISSAGGAFLEWLEGKDLPGVSALKNSKL